MSNKHDLPPLPLGEVDVWFDGHGVGKAFTESQVREAQEAVRAQFAEHIQRLEAENQALEKDAQRYRWLRGDCEPHSVRWPRFEVKYWTGRWWDDLRLAQMDAAIDAALTKGGA